MVSNMYSEEYKVSIIVPIYNVEKYLVRCVKSILNQSHHNVEIILVNDGSTDGSGGIAERLKDDDKRIFVIHQANGGLSEARNTGLDFSTGDFIFFVDSDDVINPKTIEIMLNCMLDYEADIISCDFSYWNEKENIPSVNINNGYTIRKYGSDEALISLNEIGVTACNKMYRRGVFEKIRFPIGRYHEDEYVIHELLFFSKKIIKIDVPLYYYFMRDGSITHTIDEKKVKDAINAYRERIRFIDNYNWRAVREPVIRDFLAYLFRVTGYKDKEINRLVIEEIRELVNISSVPIDYRLLTINISLARIVHKLKMDIMNLFHKI